MLSVILCVCFFAHFLAFSDLCLLYLLLRFRVSLHLCLSLDVERARTHTCALISSFSHVPMEQEVG